jgi:hypothetical protein
MAMRATEKKLVERNLDLLCEFEKYVLEHPEITEKIPEDAVVFMKVTGDKKFNLWSERQAKRQAKKGMPLISVMVKKLGPVHSRIEGLALLRIPEKSAGDSRANRPLIPEQSGRCRSEATLEFFH